MSTERLRISLVGGLCPKAANLVAEALAEQHDAVRLRIDGCVDTTPLRMREHVVPQLRDLRDDPSVTTAVLTLAPTQEPEDLCWALRHQPVDGRPAIDDVVIDGVITAIDIERWWRDIRSGQYLGSRTRGQLAVNQVELADVVVLTGRATGEQARRTGLLLDRLAPSAHRVPLAYAQTTDVLADLPATARRGAVRDPHDRLLHGDPPLEVADAISLSLWEDVRPFHPRRFQHAVQMLRDLAVRTRGRIWLAHRPDDLWWFESAGPAVRLAPAGTWLAATPTTEWETATRDPADAERHALASAVWHPRFGDRRQQLLVLVDGHDPELVHDALAAAVLTEAEIDACGPAWTPRLSR